MLTNSTILQPIFSAHFNLEMDSAAGCQLISLQHTGSAKLH